MPRRNIRPPRRFCARPPRANSPRTWCPASAGPVRLWDPALAGLPAVGHRSYRPAASVDRTPGSCPQLIIPRRRGDYGCFDRRSGPACTVVADSRGTDHPEQSRRENRSGQLPDTECVGVLHGRCRPIRPVRSQLRARAYNPGPQDCNPGCRHSPRPLPTSSRSLVPGGWVRSTGQGTPGSGCVKWR